MAACTAWASLRGGPPCRCRWPTPARTRRRRSPAALCQLVDARRAPGGRPRSSVCPASRCSRRLAHADDGRGARRRRRRRSCAPPTSSVSSLSWRRSLWPTMTQAWRPRRLSMLAEEISPVNAPEGSALMFWAAMVDAALGARRARGRRRRARTWKGQGSDDHVDPVRLAARPWSAAARRRRAGVPGRRRSSCPVARGVRGRRWWFIEPSARRGLGQKPNLQPGFGESPVREAASATRSAFHAGQLLAFFG